MSPIACLLVVYLLAADPIEADYVLRDGTIYDGGEGPAFVGDVAIKGDRVVAVRSGKLDVRAGAKEIDASGLIVAPGFIDLHSHSDGPILKARTKANLNYLTQGVTTVVTGNCGMGPVDVAGYFNTMEKIGIGSNVIHQVPHNNV